MSDPSLRSVVPAVLRDTLSAELRETALLHSARAQRRAAVREVRQPAPVPQITMSPLLMAPALATLALPPISPGSARAEDDSASTAMMYR